MRREYTQEDYLPAKGLAQWTRYITHYLMAAQVTLWIAQTVITAVEVTQQLSRQSEQHRLLGLGEDAFGVILVLTYLAAGTLFLAWSRRIVINAYAMGADKRLIGMRPFETWFWWLIPIANFFAPYGVMKHLAMATHDGATDEGLPDEVDTAIKSWWFLTVIAGCLYPYAVVRLVTGGNAFDDLGAVLIVQSIWAVVLFFEVLTWSLCLRLVAQVTRWQERKAADCLGWY
ncbi:MAG: DUF4328 domain-containing protein [Phycisphaeraceae bacterium]